MAKSMDLLHEKQRIALQRKFEESNAANIRMNEALLQVQKYEENKQMSKSFRNFTWGNNSKRRSCALQFYSGKKIQNGARAPLALWRLYAVHTLLASSHRPCVLCMYNWADGQSFYRLLMRYIPKLNTNLE